MKALLSRDPGPPETLALEDVPDLVAGAGQAVVAVRAAGVNFLDSLIIEDKYQNKAPRPFSPGSEAAGVVTSIGERVTRVKPGDRVLVFCGWGGMAEELVADESKLVKIPDAMPFDDAAAFLITYGTSWHGLKDRGRLKAGETVLVLGAAGGAGLAAVELAKAVGARVIAAASSEEKVALCKKHGADDGVVYGHGPFDNEGRRQLGKLFKDAVGPNGADVVYDAVGGDYAEPAVRALAFEGRYLVVGFAAGDIPKIPLNLTLLKSCDIAGVFWGAWAARHPELQDERWAELMDFYAQGKIKPHISERFPLARGAEAIVHLASRKAVGKVIVTVP